MPSKTAAGPANAKAAPKVSKGKGRAIEKSMLPKKFARAAESSDESESDSSSADEERGADSNEAEDSSDDDDEDDAEGMDRLLKALGKEGLAEAEEELEAMYGSIGVDDDEEDGSESGSEDASVQGSDDSSAVGVPLDEVEDPELADVDIVPKQKVVIDNATAMDSIRLRIQLDPSLDWTETLATTHIHAIDVDVNDDLNRELAFYKQALDCTQQSRALAAKAKLPFSRPDDFFAEMVKSDAHMSRIRQRLLDEQAGIKKSDDKRKEREGKKFGKQVQVEKIKERERSKKDMEDRVKGLKRKRGDIGEGADEDFDIAVEDALADKPAKRGRTGGPMRGGGRGGRGGGRGGLSRDARNQKFGFSGKDRRDKQNTRESTNDVSAFKSRGGAFGRGGKRGGGAPRGAKKRLGKSRRK